MNAISKWIWTNRIVTFVLFAFAISWTLNGLVMVLGVELSWARWIVSGSLSAVGPAFAAVIAVHVSDEGLRE